VEKEVMRQAVTASDLLDTLNCQGSVAVYINFDISKATIKADSQPVINQILKMLQDNSGLQVRIEGHTYNTGTPAKNKTLSTQRAQSVIDFLVKERS
jgi:outer membrane protein OmpA-like peptidoglycan-associated protein